MERTWTSYDEDGEAVDWATDSEIEAFETEALKKNSMSCVCSALAELPRSAHVDIDGLARMFHRCKKSIERAIRRGELPPPFKFLGKRVWIVEVLINHLQGRQAASLRQAEQREKRLLRHSA